MRLFKREIDWLNNKALIQWGGNALYFLLIFVIMLDPTNTVLHLKDIFFILLVGYNCVFFKPDFSYLPHILLIYSVILICSVLGDMQGCRIDEDLYMGTIKGFAPLVMLLWTPYYNVIKLMKWPAILVSFFIAALYACVCASELIEVFVWGYVKAHNDMIMMTHRNFLGFQVFGMYYKSMISFIFVLYLSYYKVYNVKKHRIWYAFVCVIVTFSFLVSGTRATMLLPFFMLGLVMYRTFIKWRKARYFLFPILALFVMALLMVVVLLATQQGEASNTIKYAHLTSYKLLFDSHPEYLLFGQGPGAIFYSMGFHRWTAQTEWTYIELVRNYGIFSIGMLVVFFLPIYKLWKYRKQEIPFGILGAFIAYLVIAGTNPLLVSSTGMIVLLGIYSFVRQVEKNGKMTIEML